MKWECCWSSDVVDSEQCPLVSDEEKELRFSLRRRFLEKCLECPRFSEDLKKIAEEVPPLVVVLRYLITEFLDQKEQIEYMAGFLNSRNREIQFLHEIGAVLQTSMELDEVLSVALTAITSGKGFGLNRAFLLLIDEEKRQLKGYLGVGPRSYQEAWQIWDEIGKNDFSIREMARNFLDMKLSSEKVKFQDILEKLSISLDDQAHILNRALLHAKPLLVQDAFNDAGVDPVLARTLGVDTFMILPLVSRKRRIGMIIADNFITRNPITRQDMESMEILAFPLALAIERASLYARLQEEVDKLTEANSKLKEQQQLIVKMEKMALVGQITSSIAHSIRNPLMIIGGFARSLQKSMDKGGPRHEHVDSIVDEARKLEDTLTDVLAYADSLYPVRDMWDINELAVNVSHELRSKMDKLGVACTLRLGSDLPQAFIDYRQITFCLRKIICDAIETMPHPGFIEISTRAEESALVLEVRDNSRMPVSPSGESSPATSFQAGHRSGAMPASLCRMILEKNSLSFTTDTLPEGGTIYTVKLPLSKEEVADE